MDKAGTDDLTSMRGIGPKLAQAFAKHGVTSFAQIAALDGAAIKTLEDTGDFKGNNDWAGWILVAKALIAQQVSAERDAAIVAAAGNPVALAAIEKEFDASPETIDVLYPPPAGMPASVLDAAQLVVKATTSKGRWRIGRHFTREETLIPFASISDEQKQALLDDPRIDVKLRLFKPA